MDFFADCFKNLKKSFGESSAKYKNLQVKQMNYIYFCTCGFLHSKISKTLKHIWRLYNLRSPVLMIISVVMYHIERGKITIDDFILMQVGILVSCIPIFTQLSVHLFSRRIPDLLEILDEDPVTEFNVDLFPWENKQMAKSTKFPTILRIHLSNNGMIIASWILNFGFVCFQSKYFDTPEVYFFPFPGLNKIDSFAVYGFIYLTQCIMLLTILISLFENMSFLNLLTKNMSDEFQILSEAIRANHEDFKNKLKLLYRTDRENEKRLSSWFRNQTRKRMLQFCKEFNCNMVLSSKINKVSQINFISVIFFIQPKNNSFYS